MGLLGKNTDALNDFVKFEKNLNDPADKSYNSYMKIYERVKYFYENPKMYRETINSSSAEFSEKYKFKNNKKITCDDLFGVYLNDISNYINSTFYKSVIILLRHYRDCMNILGWEIFEQYKDLLDEPTESEFCCVKNAENLPEICNDFLNNYLPNKLPSFDKHIASVIICEFCDWLYRKKFTHIRLNPNNDISVLVN